LALNTNQSINQLHQGKVYDDTRKKIKNFIDDHKKGNTVKCTERDVHTFYKWLVSRNDMRNIYNITVCELDMLLFDFFISIVNSDGSDKVIMNWEV